MVSVEARRVGGVSVFHVRLSFANSDGLVTGTWNEREPAGRKYREWLGLYGSQPGVGLQLVEERDGQGYVHKFWPPAPAPDKTPGGPTA